MFLALPAACLLLCLEITTTLGAVIQAPFESVPQQSQASEDLNAHPKKLKGKFLHISDIHPDPHYRKGTAEDSACHRKKNKKRDKKENKAGYWGTPYSECDTPTRLANYTLDFLGKNWASEIDFVVWTGDNARHDSDNKIPRTPAEIYELNREVASKMEHLFNSRGVIPIPTIGNNDVWPHNIMTPGPNSVTHEYSKIWENFIPFPYLGVFQRGGYYVKEVVPDQLAVISLNTMYFYDSNKAVNGCPWKEPSDPGNLQLDWLEVQLREFHRRGMLTYIIGHVPPSPGNYFPECYVRYVELALRFQNVVLGHLYGHMNVDHFFFLEEIDLQIVPDEDAKKARTMGGDGALYETLITEFAALPVPKRKEMDNYAVVNVAPAVVPNPYLPSFRVFTYNITDPSYDAQKKRHHGHRRGDRGDKDVHCKQPEWKNSWRCHLTQPWHSDKTAPSRRNQQWSLLGYAQYNIPHLEEADKKHPPTFELEYTTFRPSALHPSPNASAAELASFVYPIPLDQLPEELRDPTVKKSRYTPYHMKDLTIASWVKLGRKLADEKNVKLRKKFKKYMFAGRKRVK
ncbi:endopolyphosphatase [Coprinopsis sp. MPI-PUGE-AT-0042]|nr:endopolyphosphatase [Coprinopsis sp. MPI-PUGE-AT-0042]